MRAAIACFVALSVGLPAASGDDDLRQAWEAFTRGRQQIADTAAARKSFAEAARLAAQASGGAKIRRLEGHAALLAGDIAQAIRAYRRGLLVDPDDEALRRGLDLARSRVEYATAEDRQQLTWRGPAESPSRWLLRRWGVAVVAFGSSLTTVLWARWRVSGRRRLGLLVGVTACATVLVSGAWWWERHERPRETVQDFLVIRRPTAIHSGDHFAFPLRRETPLPAGVEARLLHRAAEWVQIELFDGTVGWVPADTVWAVASE